MFFSRDCRKRCEARKWRFKLNAAKRLQPLGLQPFPEEHGIETLRWGLIALHPLGRLQPFPEEHGIETDQHELQPLRTSDVAAVP